MMIRYIYAAIVAAFVAVAVYATVPTVAPHRRVVAVGLGALAGAGYLFKRPNANPR